MLKQTSSFLRWGILLALIVLCPATTERGAAQEQAAKPTVRNLSWIGGCWDHTNGNRYREEHWTKAANDSMLGMSRSLRDGRTTEFEFLRIHVNGGDIFYTAKPSGQTEASFKLVSWKEREAVFENPTHDFPQRIIYRRPSDDVLNARIEGKMNGQERGVDFPFKRAKCDAVLTN